MAIIPHKLHSHIDSAFPNNVCLVGFCQADGYAQISPRGSVQIYDDSTLSFWERSGRSTANVLQPGAKATIYYQNFALIPDGILPIGGIARFYGTVSVHASGPEYERVWERMVEGERKHDPDKTGYAILVHIERAEDLKGQPL